jgi:hypothetical protein
VIKYHCVVQINSKSIEFFYKNVFRKFEDEKCKRYAKEQEAANLDSLFQYLI